MLYPEDCREESAHLNQQLDEFRFEDVDTVLLRYKYMCEYIYIYIYIHECENNFLHITCIVKLGACMATNNESKPIPRHADEVNAQLET